MADLPAGTVTFVFTDVEGSTRLLHEHGDAYAGLLAEHRRLLREAFARYNGVEVDTQGDAFFYAFAEASDALAAARAGTEALQATPVRVRIGIHSGEPTVTEEGYVGIDVHTAARIAAAAHGGQVVVSTATKELVDAELTDLGEHRLKDIAAPVWIYQLGDERFPPLKTLSNTNLPRPVSSFVGRERELEDVRSLLRDGARLVTLSGPGGSGKTRLAIEAATELVPSFRNGTFWVGLATVRDPRLVRDTIAQTLRAKDGLEEHIGDRELLLLLDNLEQVVDSAPALAGLLEACPNLVLLVTSRELLRVRGEVEYAVAPLEGSEAVELFCQRARLPPDEAVSELCRRLDNLPLAVELAAARTSVLSPPQILERISQRLDVLKGGRDADARQRTLRATIEWSYDLLSDEEKELFGRIAVFDGGCTLEAAEHVADADLEGLQSLVDKSLLRFTNERFWMLETIREYARERLEASGAREVYERHFEFFCRVAADLRGDLWEASHERAMRAYEAEYPNLRAALSWAREAGDPDRVLRLASTLSDFWRASDHLREGLEWLEEAMSVDSGPQASARARVLTNAAGIVSLLGDLDSSMRWAEEAVELYRGLGDDEGTALALTRVANVFADRNDGRRAAALYEEAAKLARQAGDDRMTAVAVMNAGIVAQEEGRLDEAEVAFREARELFAKHGNKRGLGVVLSNLAGIAVARGRRHEATELLRECGQLYRELGTKVWTARFLETLAELQCAHGARDHGLRLIGAARRLREETTTTARASEQLLDGIAADLDEKRIRELLNEGGAMAMTDAIDYALAVIDEDADAA